MDNFFENISRQEGVTFGELSGEAAVDYCPMFVEIANQPVHIRPADDEGFTVNLHPVFQAGGSSFCDSAGFQQAFQEAQDGRFQGMEVNFADDDVSAGFDDPRQFGDGFFDIRDVHQDSAGQCSLESTVCKGQVQQIALFYGDRVLQSQPAHILSCVFEDDGRKIDPGHFETAPGQSERIEARSAAGVEEAAFRGQIDMCKDPIEKFFGEHFIFCRPEYVFPMLVDFRGGEGIFDYFGLAGFYFGS